MLAGNCLLIGDIGGTHARFALADASAPGFSTERTFNTADFETAELAIARYLEDLKTGSRDRDRVKRLSTLLPLARNAIFVALVIFVTLIVLSELGINIGPLLAGAGVGGLAIGPHTRADVYDAAELELLATLAHRAGQALVPTGSAPGARSAVAAEAPAASAEAGA